MYCVTSITNLLNKLTCFKILLSIFERCFHFSFKKIVRGSRTEIIKSRALDKGRRVLIFPRAPLSAYDFRPSLLSVYYSFFFFSRSFCCCLTRWRISQKRLIEANVEEKRTRAGYWQVVDEQISHPRLVKRTCCECRRSHHSNALWQIKFTSLSFRFFRSFAFICP